LQKSKGPGTAAPGPSRPKGYIRPATFLAPILAPQLRLSIPASGRRNKPGLFGASAFAVGKQPGPGSSGLRAIRESRTLFSAPGWRLGCENNQNAPAAISESPRGTVGDREQLERKIGRRARSASERSGKWVTFAGKHSDCMEWLCDPPASNPLIRRHLNIR
jgi:hypothetical protein